MRKVEIIEVLSNYETIYTTLEEAKKGTPIVPSMNEFLQLLLIERLGGIEGELDSLWDALVAHLGEQDTKEFVQKMSDADDAEDEQEFLERVENAEDLE